MKVDSCTLKDAEQEFLGPTSGKCGELSLEGVFQNGRQNFRKWHIKAEISHITVIIDSTFWYFLMTSTL